SFYPLSSSIALGNQAQAAGVFGKANDGAQRQIVRTFDNIPVLIVNLGPARSPPEVPLGDAGQRVIGSDAVHRLARFAVKITCGRFCVGSSFADTVDVPFG